MIKVKIRNNRIIKVKSIDNEEIIMAITVMKIITTVIMTIIIIIMMIMRIKNIKIV